MRISWERKTIKKKTYKKLLEEYVVIKVLGKRLNLTREKDK